MADLELYVTKWPEDRVLDYFRTMVAVGVDRIALLQQLSAVVIQRPDDWDQVDVRRQTRRPFLRFWDCFGCLARDRKLYFHHVIWVAHGGSAIIDNLVPICLKCHARIHPWLPSERAGELLGGWHSIASIGETVAPRVVHHLKQVAVGVPSRLTP